MVFSVKSTILVDEYLFEPGSLKAMCPLVPIHNILISIPQLFFIIKSYSL